LKPAYTLVRDALPLERLSCARIRQWLADDTDLGSWSRTEPGAIRPQQLAALIRDRIWEAHDVSLATVRDRLDRADEAQQPRQAEYWVKVEIEKQPDKKARVLSRTRFSSTPNGRICAEICIVADHGNQTLTDGPVPLRRRGET
jgi:hypothetical protein